MSDVKLGALLTTMGNVLVAILIFAAGMVPLSVVALFAAWLACAKQRTHFFERKIPERDTFLAFNLLFGLAHIVTTFIMAMTMGVQDGASALTIVTYSVASVVTVTLGLSLGAFMLGGLWHLFQAKFPNASKSGGLGSYEPVATTPDEHELESGSHETQESTEATVKV